MKRIICILTAITFLLPTVAFPQQCVSCVNNSVDFNAAASAIGQNNTATGWASLATGNYSKSIGDFSTAIGYHAESLADISFTFGRYVKTSAGQSFSLGLGYLNLGQYLNNYVPNSMMIGFNSTAPTFFVSESFSDDNHPDRTGRVAIGNMTDPQAKLHIYADDNESATLFLQPSNWNTKYNAEIWLGDTSHGISAEKDEGLVYQTKENHIFKGGNVYIEDIDKGIIMKSPDGRCWLGTLDNNGSLNFTVMESCPGAPDAIHETQGSGPDNGLKVYPNPTNGYLTIEIENPGHKLLSVSLLDEKGHEVLIKQIHTGKTQIYTGDLKTGIYFVRVTGNGKKMVEKVVRQ